MGPALFIKCLAAEELFTLGVKLDIAEMIYHLTVGTEITWKLLPLDSHPS